ncbi:Flp pilus assembly protein TadD [Sphingomonas sp. F9_3S_D5_B_2]
MSKPVRFGSVVSLLVVSSMMVGCAAPQGRALTAGSTSMKGDVALALRAAAALNSNDYPAAVALAERAAQKTPQDATVRTLLGNAYFASGRFASAEAAYKDSLFVQSNQPGVILKLVLVQIAEGKTAEALTFLDAGRDVIDAADYGLALALAGRPEAGVSVLEPAARSVGADARVRQNLALAYALSGDWAKARTIASQDVPADQLDARIHQWMQLASPHRASDQVAALVGVTPAASDPGQPVQLALRQADTRFAQAAPAPAPAPVASVAVNLPLPEEEPALAQQPMPAPLEQAVYSEPAPAPLPAVAVAPEPSASQAPVHQAAMTMAQAAMASPEAPAAFAAMVTKAPFHAPARKAPQVRHAAVAPHLLGTRKGQSGTVVQIGAYAAPQRVAAAWTAASRRFGGLRAYTPMSARFDGPKGTVYRLSVKGFTTLGEAKSLCLSVRRAGGSCFVRNFAGDAPVQIAMR